MFSFAKNFVKTLEQSAESIITTSSNLINTESDPYFLSAGTAIGFRVLHVEAGSEAAQLGLEPWFDYIVGINNHELLTAGSQLSSTANAPNNPSLHGLPDYNLLVQEIQNCMGQPLALTVWNAKGGVLRQVHVPEIRPFEDRDGAVYNQQGYLVAGDTRLVANNRFAPLGAALQATPLATATYVYHVLEIQPRSPAEQCGLLPFADYIVGANDGLFATGGEDLFARVINSIYNRSQESAGGISLEIQLYVYNHEFDVVRPVTVALRSGWGGSGILGCGVGYGYLHRLPQVVGKFEDQEHSSTLFNPADQPLPQPVEKNSNRNSNSSPHYLQAPGVTLFSVPGEANASSEFVPAELAGAPPLAAAHNDNSSEKSSNVEAGSLTGAPPRRKKKHAAKTVNASDFSDYFREETERSEKLDVRSKSGPDLAALPPPPKLSH